MTDSGKLPVEVIAQSVVDEAVHYVESVSAMASSHDLIATADIVSPSGIKLVACGTRIDDRLREKLKSHHVTGAMLEHNISIAGGLDSELLSRDAAKLIDEDSWFRTVEMKSGDPGAMRHGISRLNLQPEILFRLTVARHQRPSLYQHLLSVTIISHYIGLRLHLSQSAIDSLLIAALCHDLGELYTPPEILEPGHKVSEDERRFIYVHPITGWLITRDLQGLDPLVAKAIIQHQERLDGSGYPNGIAGGDICLAGRILAAADVSATIMARFGNHHRLSTLLRLNRKKYDLKVIGLLHDAVAPATSVVEKLEHEKLTSRLINFAYLLDAWSYFRAQSKEPPAAPMSFLSERIYNLRTVVLESGFDPDSLEILIELAEEDATIAAELYAVVDELQFQLADLAREFDRRMSAWRDALDQPIVVLLDDWRLQLQDCIDA